MSQDPPPPIVGRLARWDEFPRYIALVPRPIARAHLLGVRLEATADDLRAALLDLVGGNQKPTAFKTVKGARRAAGDDGFVLLLDLLRLPVILHEQETEGVRMCEAEFAERQSMLWAGRVAALAGETDKAIGLSLERAQRQRERRKEMAAIRRARRAADRGAPVLLDLVIEDQPPVVDGDQLPAEED